MGKARARDLMRRHLRDVAAIEDDLTGTRTRIATNGHQQGRFACTISADERDDLTFGHIKVDAMQDFDAAIA